MYNNDRFTHNNERQMLFIKRFEQKYSKIIDINDNYHDQKLVILFDIITVLGGNKRRDSGKFIEPMIINNIDIGLIKYLIDEYSQDHLVLFDNEINIIQLQKIYFEIIYEYLKFRHANQ